MLAIFFLPLPICPSNVFLVVEYRFFVRQHVRATLLSTWLDMIMRNGKETNQNIRLKLIQMSIIIINIYICLPLHVCLSCVYLSISPLTITLITPSDD